MAFARKLGGLLRLRERLMPGEFAQGEPLESVLDRLSASDGRPRSPVANARKISPLPWLAVEPVRARPRPARLARRTQAAESTGASVTTTTMQEPAGGCGSRGLCSAPSSRPTATPLTVSRSRRPKLERSNTPTV